MTGARVKRPMTVCVAALLALVGYLVLALPAVAETPCRLSAGPAKARRLVAQCLMVSPATHPPCNAANACDLIEDEIRRGCRMLDADAPTFCAPYRRQ
jgi:hypothetical protein